MYHMSGVFSQTKILARIKTQGACQLLEVPIRGSFKVEWHLAVDMKIKRCLYGLRMGANNLHSCIYCLQDLSLYIYIAVSTLAYVVSH